MDIAIKQTNLLKAIKVASRLSNNRSSLPILSSVLLVADDSGIQVTSTDLEAAVIYKIPGKVNKSGSVTLPAKLLLDLVGVMGSDTVSIKSEGNKADLSTDRVQSSINGMPIEEFPVIPEIDDSNKFSLSPSVFRQGLAMVSGASSKDDTRPILNGVYINSTGNKCTFVATDSYRLSESIVELDSPVFSFVIPNQTVQELMLILDSSESLAVSLQDNQVQFSTDEATLISKTIDGKYPDYKNLIPKDSEVKITTQKEELITATKTAGLFAREAGGSIQFKSNEDRFSVESTGTQVGQNNTVIKGEVVGQGEVSFNSRFMAEALTNLKSENVDIGFSSSISPITVVGHNDPGFTQLIMPLKT